MDYLSEDSFCIANNSDDGDGRNKRKSSGDDNQKGSSVEQATSKYENVSTEKYSTAKDVTESGPSNNSKREDHVALDVNVDDAQNDLDVEMSNHGQKQASSEGEEQANGENDVIDSKTESNTKKSTEEGQSKAERLKDADNASNKEDESESNDKGKLESKSTTTGDKKQEDDKCSAPSSNKAKRLVVTLPKQLPFCLKKC